MRCLSASSQYGSIWLKLGSIGLTRENAWVIGLLISVTFIVTASIALHPKTPKQFALALAALGSPAVMLGVELANVDLVIYVALLIATYFIARPRALDKVLGAALCLLLTVVKLYPTVAFVSIFWSMSTRRRALFALCAFVVAVGAWAAFRSEEVQTIIGAFEKPGLNGPTHGGSLLYVLLMFQGFVPATLDPIRAGQVTFVLTYLASLACALFAVGVDRAPLLDRVRLIAGAAIAVLAFGVTTNYDYRNIFLLFVLPFLFQYHRDTRSEGPLARFIGTSTPVPSHPCFMGERLDSGPGKHRVAGRCRLPIDKLHRACRAFR